MTGQAPPRQSPIAVLSGKWHEFWFTKEPAYTLGLVRIVFGAVMVYVTLGLLPSLLVLFGETGPVPKQPGTEFKWVQPYGWGIFQNLTSDTALIACWVLLLVSSVALMVGWHSRIAAVMVWFLFLSFIRRNPPIFSFGDHLFSITALILALSACGAALSLDQRRRTGTFWSAESRARWPVRLLQVQLCLIYLFAVQTKVTGSTWTDGSAVAFPWRAFHDWAILPVPQWISGNPFLVNVATWGTLLVELSLVFLVWNKRCRYWVLGAGVVMHVLIWLNLSVAFFSLQILALYLVWVPWDTVRDLPDRVREARSRRRRRGRGAVAEDAVTEKDS